ncbi:Hypothetical predicted protein [Podarcis lilfordi]|uniref:Uncharacterized protein n=1 Tax=Podarcis lilfordi TaxID=74358 RepID=A0AA35PE87_9SAUR|nr:Hypothetical predicted protein [Podarcis lilfordi]
MEQCSPLDKTAYPLLLYDNSPAISLTFILKLEDLRNCKDIIVQEEADLKNQNSFSSSQLDLAVKELEELKNSILVVQRKAVAELGALAPGLGGVAHHPHKRPNERPGNCGWLQQLPVEQQREELLQGLRCK